MSKRSNAMSKEDSQGCRTWDREKKLWDLGSVLGDGISWNPVWGRVLSIHFIASNSVMWLSSLKWKAPLLAMGAWLPTDGQTGWTVTCRIHLSLSRRWTWALCQ